MKKFIFYLIPTAALVLFSLIMLSGNIMKKPRNGDEDFPKYLETVKADVNSSQWENADANLDKASAAWDKIAKRVQFSVERDEINEIKMNLSRIDGAITAQDKSNAIIELSEAKMHWDNLAS